MNIVQLHERVRFWLDIVSSPRFESQDIDNALNVAIDSKIRESYDDKRPINRSDTFQRVQRLRDELGPLVKKLSLTDFDLVYNTTDKITELSFKSGKASDYGWLLSFRIKFDNNGWKTVMPLTYNRKNTISANPFRRVRSTSDSYIYYHESSDSNNDMKWLILHDYYATDTINDVEVYYLATGDNVNYGIEYDSSKVFNVDDIIIAVEETVYDSTTYTIGSDIKISGTNYSITSGKVVYGYTNPLIRSTAHEEISRRAAINLLLTAGLFDKARSLREEILAS